MAFPSSGETFTPLVNLKSRATADVEIIDNVGLTVQPYYVLSSSVARYGGCLVTKDAGTQMGVSPATANATTGAIFGMTHSSIQDLSAAAFRLNEEKYTRHLGTPPGVIQGRGNVWLRRFKGTVLPGDLLIVGPSGYPQKSTGTGIIIGIAATSGIGNIDLPTTSIMATIDLPAFGSGLVQS